MNILNQIISIYSRYKHYLPNIHIFSHMLPFFPLGDGPDQNTMVGFLSEQRVMSIDCGDNRRATLLDIACRLDHARRHRAWRAPQPYEAAICVYVNIATGRRKSWALVPENGKMVERERYIYI